MVVTLLPMVTLVRLVQHKNAYFPMLVTLFGMVMLVKLVQPKNAEFPMLVTLFGMVMLVRLVQPENAEFPMLVTLFGMVMLVRLVQLWNAKSPMLVPLVITTDFNALLFTNEQAKAGMVADSIGQPENAYSPMYVTLFGIMMLLRLVQPRNA